MKNKNIELSNEINLTDRLDVVAKLIYAKARIDNVEEYYALGLYKDSIKAINYFHENDGSGKTGSKAFVESFNQVIDSIKHSGFNSTYGKIPLTKDGGLCNGAHRLAASYATNNLPEVELTDLKAFICDHGFYEKNGLAEKYLDSIAIEYSKFNKNSFVIVLWPATSGNDQTVEEIIKKKAKIFYQKRINLTLKGVDNCVKQLYEGESWLGSKSDCYPGSIGKSANCHSDGNFTRVYLVDSNLKDILKIKNDIRELFNIDKNSVHINDTHSESILMSKLFFNANTVNYLNNSHKIFSDTFEQDFDKFILEVDESDKENYAVVSGGVLSLFGTRATSDFDYIKTTLSEPLTFGDDATSKWIDKGFNTNELLLDPKNYFYYRGVKILTLKNVESYMKIRNGKKDKRDLFLIKNEKHKVSCVLHFKTMKQYLNPRFIYYRFIYRSLRKSKLFARYVWKMIAK